MLEKKPLRKSALLALVLPATMAACTGFKSCTTNNGASTPTSAEDVPQRDMESPQRLTQEAPVKPLTPEEAQAAIGARAKEAIDAWKSRDAATLASLTHPTKGVRFSPYSFVEVKSDILFKKEDMANFFANDRAYIWGTWDGKGGAIQLPPRDYYSQFIYPVDFVNAEKTSYNTLLGRGSSIENMTEVYPRAAWVEYYFSGINPSYGGMDWQSLRLLFEKEGEEWYLVGVVHNQWTS